MDNGIEMDLISNPSEPTGAGISMRNNDVLQCVDNISSDELSCYELFVIFD